MKLGTCDRYAKEIKLREREKQLFFAAVINFSVYAVILSVYYIEGLQQEKKYSDQGGSRLVAAQNQLLGETFKLMPFLTRPTR